MDFRLQTDDAKAMRARVSEVRTVGTSSAAVRSCAKGVALI